MTLKKLFLLAIAIIAAGLSSAATDFTYTYEGSKLKYTTINDSTCSVVGFCYLIEDLKIPEKVTYKDISYTVTAVENATFERLDLTSVTLPNSLTSIGNEAFFRCSHLRSLKLPNSLTSIGIYAFYQCSDLTSVTLPNSLTSIGESALGNCSELNSITIPNSVTSIGTRAFKGCDMLREVYSNIKDPFAINDVFDNATLNEGVLRVISGTIDKYRAVAQWNQFANIKEDRVSSVAEVDGDEVFSVYGLDGVEVRCDCSLRELDTLPKGVYILVSASRRFKIVR